MSALGHKRTSQDVSAMSALPPKADMVQRNRDVRFVPKADSCTAAILVTSLHEIANFRQQLARAKRFGHIAMIGIDRKAASALIRRVAS